MRKYLRKSLQAPAMFDGKVSKSSRQSSKQAGKTESREEFVARQRKERESRSADRRKGTFAPLIVTAMRESEA